MGIQAIVGESFAEIFAGNCTALGIPTVRLEPKEIEFLMAAVAEKPELILTVDLSAGTVAAGDSVFSLSMPESYRQSLLAGTWDTTATLLLNLEKIAQTARKLPYIAGY
jgi:3-isopropylmalate/(R)-2-methylmalate dehydratase small subunit